MDSISLLPLRSTGNQKNAECWHRRLTLTMSPNVKGISPIDDASLQLSVRLWRSAEFKQEGTKQDHSPLFVVSSSSQYVVFSSKQHISTPGFRPERNNDSICTLVLRESLHNPGIPHVQDIKGQALVSLCRGECRYASKITDGCTDITHHSQNLRRQTSTIAISLSCVRKPYTKYRLVVHKV